MPNAPLCPSRNDLRRFALGDVHKAEAQTLGQHLDTCTRCLETLEAEEQRRYAGGFAARSGGGSSSRAG